MNDTSDYLPEDHGSSRINHYTAAEKMRRTGQWVRVSTYANRRSAHNASSRIRKGRIKAYRDGTYDALARQNEQGEAEVWARWIGPK